MTFDQQLEVFKEIVPPSDWGEFYPVFVSCVSNFDPSVGPFKNFLARSVKLRRYDAYRKAERRKAVSFCDHDPDWHVRDQNPVFDKIADADEIRAAIARLDHNFERSKVNVREVFRLMLRNHGTIERMSETLGIPPGTVKSTMSRIRQRASTALKTL